MARLKLDLTAARPPRLSHEARTRFAAMTEEEIETLSGDEEHAAASDEQLDHARMARRIRAVRTDLNLTQDGLGSLLRIPVATIRDWEQGRREPDRPAKALFRILEREPDAVRRALSER